MAKKPGFSEHDLEELTSYLDREVNETELSDWDQRIANDPAARQEAAKLQRAWDALDLLPNPRTADNFAKRTAELAKIDQQQETQLQASVRSSNWLIYALYAAAIVGTFVLGNYASSFVQHPNQLIMDHRQVIENMPVYSEIKSVEYLELLAKRRQEWHTD